MTASTLRLYLLTVTQGAERYSRLCFTFLVIVFCSPYWESSAKKVSYVKRAITTAVLLSFTLKAGAQHGLINIIRVWLLTLFKMRQTLRYKTKLRNYYRNLVSLIYVHGLEAKAPMKRTEEPSGLGSMTHTQWNSLLWPWDTYAVIDWHQYLWTIWAEPTSRPWFSSALQFTLNTL